MRIIRRGVSTTPTTPTKLCDASIHTIQSHNLSRNAEHRGNERRFSDCLFVSLLCCCGEVDWSALHEPKPHSTSLFGGSHDGAVCKQPEHSAIVRKARTSSNGRASTPAAPPFFGEWNPHLRFSSEVLTLFSVVCPVSVHFSPSINMRKA